MNCPQIARLSAYPTCFWWRRSTRTISDGSACRRVTSLLRIEVRVDKLTSTPFNAKERSFRVSPGLDWAKDQEKARRRALGHGLFKKTLECILNAANRTRSDCSKGVQHCTAHVGHFKDFFSFDLSYRSLLPISLTQMGSCSCM